MPYFVVHEHHSRKLHYDFRLEMDGVLKSWAVPKGPSMSPKDKRLAVEVSDHPIEYGTFEGIIPEGHYGAGPVVIWDSGEYELRDGSIEEGKLEFFLKGKRLRGLFVLLKMKNRQGQWLLIKKKDQYAVEDYKLQVALTPEVLKGLKERVPPCETE